MAALRLCEICKNEIEPERSEHLPQTRLCSEHAREIERFGGEFSVVGTQEDTAKKTSLKRNYGGGISTISSRNQEAIDALRSEFESGEHRPSVDLAD